MSKTKRLRKTQVQLQALADRILQAIAADPHRAFAASIVSRIPEQKNPTQSLDAHEKHVRCILRRLAHIGLLRFKTVWHPNGSGDRVQLYTLTPKGEDKLSSMPRVKRSAHAKTG